MVLFLSIALPIVFLYSLIILLLSWGMGRLDIEQALSPRIASPVTLIIPFRDEKSKLSDLVKDLSQQSYPEDLFEVIFVNDHSRDGSETMLNNLINENSRFLCLDLPDNGQGKKEALLYAVQHAKSEWIIQTDADCRLGPDFIASHMAFLETNPSDMVAGLVTTGNGTGSFLESFERLDLLSLVGTGAGSFHFGRPLMCNGANLAYSRLLYLETRQFEPAAGIPSGDDMFLMIGARKLGKTLSYNANLASMVKTLPVGGTGELIRQRIRWGSKTMYYKMIDIQVLALLVVLVNIVILVLLLLSLFATGYWPWLMGVFVTKTAADFYLLFKITG
jgi:biofilm PGA synthesis N-glycosyltransferase PgaC